MAIYIMKDWYGKSGNAKTMTVLLDLNNSNPTKWATYADDAVGMVAGSDAWDDFFGHYPCILENGVELGKLKRNNFAQYENGTTAPITDVGKDVMIAFPKRGFKIAYTDANTLSVSMTSEEGKAGYTYAAHTYNHNIRDTFYLGAYLGYVSSNKMYSSSSKAPTCNLTIDDFRTYAQARGTGYDQSGYFQLTFRQVMYALKYKCQNAQEVIGLGNRRPSTAIATTGATNNRGMDWGNLWNEDFRMKLFGIEDFYGNGSEWVDGILSGATNVSVLGKNIHVGTSPYNYWEAAEYTDTGIEPPRAWTYFIRYPYGTNLLGFLGKPNTATGNSSTYFCDVSIVWSSGWNYPYVCALMGESHNHDEGVFSLQMNYTPYDKSARLNSRLMYIKQ